jgi:ParB family chromosome partitioning protein
MAGDRSSTTARPGQPIQPRRGGLGRGLAALIPTAPVRPVGPGGSEGDAPAVGSTATQWSVPPRPTVATGATDPTHEPSGVDGGPGPVSGNVAGAVYREVHTDRVVPNPKQPRRVFDEDALAELEHSIREFGLMQPIVVRELPGERFELVMGERRLRAAVAAGLERIPAIVRETDDAAMLRDALLENIHRVALNPLEEAAAYQQLLQEFGVTHEQLADRLGRSRPAITNTIRLLKLPVPVQKRVAAGVLSAGHARALLGLDEPGMQEDLATRIIAEGLSVRGTEEAVVLLKRQGPVTPRPPARKPLQAPGLQQVADRLSDAFETRVKVELGRRKGRIVVEFGSVDDLERIVGLMSQADQ